MTEGIDEDGWQRLDWDSFDEEPMIAGGFMVVLRGTTPVPMDVEFYDLPVGIAPVDYQGVVVRGRPKDPTIEVESAWVLERDLGQFPQGMVGFVLLGATKREYVPPRNS